MIRNIESADITAIPGFIRSNSSMKPHSEMVYKVFTRFSSDTCLVVEEEKQIKGIMFGLIAFGRPENFFVWYLILAPELRRFDVISRLCGTALKAASERGCTRLQFTLYDNSPESGRLLSFAKRFLGRKFTKEHFLTTTNELGETVSESLYEFPMNKDRLTFLQ